MRIHLHDLTLRLSSLVLALLLWFAVAGQKSAEVAVPAPLEFRNVPEGLELVGNVPHSVEVWLRGSPGIVQRVRANEVYVPIDLGGAGQGPRTVHISGADIRVPYGVRIAAVRPAAFTFTLERTVQRTLPVKAEVVGRPAAGYRVAGVSVEPAQVSVIGPESRVSALVTLSTEPVVVDGAQMTLSRDVEIGPPEAPLRIVDPHLIHVTVRLERDGGS